MALAVVVLARTRNLFAVVVLSGLYSFLMATVMLALDAVDVAMTEAAVGAGVSTVLFLGALHLCKSEEAKPAHRPWLPLSLAVVTAGVLIYGAMGLPDFADPQAPIHQHVIPRYLANEVDVPNVVTAVLASFRGFDTLGEVTVIFTAGAGVVALLRRRRHRASGEKGEPACTDLPLRVIAKLLIPFVLLFALYVQVHGDYGPGGGFQAGVIFASGIVFYALVFGVENARRVIPDRLVEGMIAAGVLLYLAVGVAGLLLGGNFLDYFVLDPDPVHGQHRGIFWIELGVLITVCGVMLKIFYMFASRGTGEGRQ